ncbi:MAG: hypothetical protein CMP49_03295 [Flavobacteriales bacterium]|nr:hypothetical protein [Flavobacteriales bacterium]|tara:strand:+ start:316 stop:645 length:330 start_codon:yes stop_codon:yes gene_type:complete
MKNLLILLLIIISTDVCANPINEGPTLKEQLSPPNQEFKQTLQKRSQIWIKGQWAIVNNTYVWVKGHWETKRAGFVFVDGNWIKKSNGWTWKEGYWKKIDMNKWLNLHT